MKRFLTNKIIAAFVDLVTTPVTFLAASWTAWVRKMINYLPLNAKVFHKAGFWPVADHYYQPMVNPKKHLKKNLADDRELPGIDWNDKSQLELLEKFHYNDELLAIPLKKAGELKFYYDNPSFNTGDAEYLYNMIRYFKPKRIIEIGSGFSTLMTLEAINKNREEDPKYECTLTFIEPYPQPWLLKVKGGNIIQEKVEDVDQLIFEKLEKDDILFIDSSHVIRPQGDVLTEYLTILPKLQQGVIIHAHDIFSPRDYLDTFIYKFHFMWNEQYLLEAFLSFNNDFKIIGALHYLQRRHLDKLLAKCPVLAKAPNRRPGSFWFMKVS